MKRRSECLDIRKFQFQEIGYRRASEKNIHWVYLSFRCLTMSDNGNSKKLNFELRRSRQQLLRKTLSVSQSYRSNQVSRFTVLKFSFHSRRIDVPNVSLVIRAWYLAQISLLMLYYSCDISLSVIQLYSINIKILI